ncbi:MAG: hypothetical protein IJ151_09525 [Bacteroidales bacterium]|nr:hypothetical protein [Bacteroidales bacterium]MBQ9186091.1 hypothetical protein [Bacteroidales bacterium]
MKKIFCLLSIALAVAACDTKEETLELQHFKTPGVEEDLTESDLAYYKNLREWKESKHTISYVYFAAWAPPEGATSLFIEYQTMRPRLISLPDSLDIVNLWMGTPMKQESTDACFYGNVKNPETGEIERKPMNTYDYSPNAYADLEFCQKYKGTKFVMHADASHYGQEFELDGQYWKVESNNEESIRAYGRLVVDIVNTHGLDGVDFDYEGWGGNQIFWVIDEVGKYFGPQGSDPSKLLIVDYFGGYPGGNIEPYINYLVKQAYSAQGSSTGGPSWCPAEKMVYCEQYEQSSGEGPNYLNGGYPTGRTNEAGEKMYTLESYARYASEATEGLGGGFGAYYIDNDYANGQEALKAKGYANYHFDTYGFLRRAIQIVNPAK